LNVSGGDLRVDITSSDSSPANDGQHDKLAVTNANFSAASTISPFFTSGVPSAGNYTPITSTNAMTHSVTRPSPPPCSRLTFTPQFLSGDTILNLNVTGNGAGQDLGRQHQQQLERLRRPLVAFGGGDNAFANLTPQPSTTAPPTTTLLTQTVTPRIRSSTPAGRTTSTPTTSPSPASPLALISRAAPRSSKQRAGTNTFAGLINLDNATTLDSRPVATIGTGPIGATNASLKINRSAR
jgi:hypothetical protein